MAGLQADLSSEFLKNFLSETIYVVSGEEILPAPIPVAVASETAATETIHASVQLETPPEAPAPQTAPAPKAAPAISKIPKPEQAAPTLQKYKVLGENSRGVVVLVTLPDADFLQLPQLGFLQKILGAIGLKPADVAYVNNLSGDTARFEDLQQELEVSYIISFASRLDTEQPHDKFTLYNPVTIGAVPIVFSQSLKMLENDVEHKKLLWGALQKVFL